MRRNKIQERVSTLTLGSEAGVDEMMISRQRRASLLCICSSSLPSVKIMYSM